jgi:hypothetical protein
MKFVYDAEDGWDEDELGLALALGKHAIDRLHRGKKYPAKTSVPFSRMGTLYVTVLTAHDKGRVILMPVAPLLAARAGQMTLSGVFMEPGFKTPRATSQRALRKTLARVVKNAAKGNCSAYLNIAVYKSLGLMSGNTMDFDLGVRCVALVQGEKLEFIAIATNDTGTVQRSVEIPGAKLGGELTGYLTVEQEFSFEVQGVEGGLTTVTDEMGFVWKIELKDSVTPQLVSFTPNNSFIYPQARATVRGFVNDFGLFEGKVNLLYEASRLYAKTAATKTLSVDADMLLGNFHVQGSQYRFVATVPVTNQTTSSGSGLNSSTTTTATYSEKTGWFVVNIRDMTGAATWMGTELYYSERLYSTGFGSTVSSAQQTTYSEEIRSAGVLNYKYRKEEVVAHSRIMDATGSEYVYTLNGVQVPYSQWSASPAPPAEIKPIVWSTGPFTVENDMLANSSVATINGVAYAGSVWVKQNPVYLYLGVKGTWTQNITFNNHPQDYLISFEKNEEHFLMTHSDDEKEIFAFERESSNTASFFSLQLASDLGKYFAARFIEPGFTSLSLMLIDGTELTPTRVNYHMQSALTLANDVKDELVWTPDQTAYDSVKYPANTYTARAQDARLFIGLFDSLLNNLTGAADDAAVRVLTKEAIHTHFLTVYGNTLGVEDATGLVGFGRGSFLVFE